MQTHRGFIALAAPNANIISSPLYRADTPCFGNHAQPPSGLASQSPLQTRSLGCTRPSQSKNTPGEALGPTHLLLAERVDDLIRRGLSSGEKSFDRAGARVISPGHAQRLALRRHLPDHPHPEVSAGASDMKKIVIAHHARAGPAERTGDSVQ